jgi:hypothetical protein
VEPEPVTSDAERLAALWRQADIITPLALRVAATLRLADHVAAGHDRVVDLARHAGAEPDALRRLLRYLTARGIFSTPRPDRVALNDVAHLLRDDHPSGTRRWLDLEGFGGRMDLAFVDLLRTVRDGHAPRPIHDDELTASLSASFDDMMESQSRVQTPAIVAAYPWSGVRHVVDVGGGTGTQLIGLLRAQAALRGSLVELPRTAERAMRLVAEAGLTPRCTILAGDLFAVALPAADAYLLKFVLHGLDDAAATTALRRCAAAGGPAARVLIVERTAVPGEDLAPFTAMDLRMLILGEGRERTLEEYGALAEGAGLVLAGATPTAVGVHLLELRRPEPGAAVRTRVTNDPRGG